MSDRAQTPNTGMLSFAVPRPTVTMVTDKFPEGAVFLLCQPELLQPEFVRMPEAKEGDKCPVTGLSRSKMEDLLKEAGKQINARKLRKRGATRGIVLIDRKSLIEYINNKPHYCEEETGGDDQGV